VFDKQTTYRTSLKAQSVRRIRSSADGQHLVTFSLTAYSHKYLDFDTMTPIKMLPMLH
jgi:hypothetical protein